MAPVCQQSIQFCFTSRFTKGTAHNPDKARLNAKITTTLSNSLNYRFDDAATGKLWLIAI